MRGLHYGQELASTNRPDTFAQTKPPTTTILLAIWRRTIHFHGLLFAGNAGYRYATSAMRRTRHETLIVIGCQ